MHQSLDRGNLVRVLLWSLSGDLLAKLAMVPFAVISARVLSTTQFGQLVGLQAASLLAVAAWDFGVSPLLTRELAAGAVGVRKALSKVGRLRASTLGLWIGVFGTGTFFLGRQAPISMSVIVVMALASLVLGSNQIALAILRSRLQFRAIGIATAVGRWISVAIAALTLTNITPQASFLLLAFALLAGETLILMGAGAVIGSTSLQGSEDQDSGSLTLKEALPFTGSGVMQISYNRLDVVMVAALASPDIVGSYALASRMQDGMLILPSAASAVMFPLAAALFADERGSARPTRSRWGMFTTVTIGFSIGVTVLVLMLTPGLVTALFGDRYSASIFPIRIISLSIPIIAFNALLAAVVNARRKAHYVTGAIAVALSSSLIFNIALVPRLGAEGAALAATLREIPTGVVLVFAAKATGLFAKASNKAWQVSSSSPI